MKWILRFRWKNREQIFVFIFGAVFCPKNLANARKIMLCATQEWLQPSAPRLVHLWFAPNRAVFYPAHVSGTVCHASKNALKLNVFAMTTATTTTTIGANEWKYWHSPARVDNVEEQIPAPLHFLTVWELCHSVKFWVVCNTPTRHNYGNNKYRNNSSEIKWSDRGDRLAVTDISGTFTVT